MLEFRKNGTAKISYEKEREMRSNSRTRSDGGERVQIVREVKNRKRTSESFVQPKSQSSSPSKNDEILEYLYCLEIDQPPSSFAINDKYLAIACKNGRVAIWESTATSGTTLIGEENEENDLGDIPNRISIVNDSSEFGGSESDNRKTFRGFESLVNAKPIVVLNGFNTCNDNNDIEAMSFGNLPLYCSYKLCTASRHSIVLWNIEHSIADPETYSGVKIGSDVDVVYDVCFDHEDKLLSICTGSYVQIYDIMLGVTCLQIEGHKAAVTKSIFSSTRSGLLYTISADRTFKVCGTRFSMFSEQLR